MNISIGHDYLLSNTLKYFENYMFCTTQKHMAGMTSFSEFHTFVTDGETDEENQAVTDVRERKNAALKFNRMLKSHGLNPDRDGPQVPCIIIYLEPDVDDSPDILSAAWKRLVKIMEEAGQGGRRCIAMTSHFHQVKDGTRQYPHVHIMYEKAPEVTDELQEFIWEKLVGYIPEDW